MKLTGERGALSVILLLLLLVMIGACTALVQVLAAVQQSADREQASAQALCLAESGVEVALHHLAARESYLGERNTPLGTGRYTVTVLKGVPLEILAVGEAPYGGCLTLRRSIRVRGTLAGGRFRLREWTEFPAANLPGAG